MDTTKKKRGPLRRISSAELVKIGEVLQHAILYLEPEEFTQRRMVANYLPELYHLRIKGYTFNQLAQLLSQADSKITPGTVRIYYNEMLPERLDECQRAIN